MVRPQLVPMLALALAVPATAVAGGRVGFPAVGVGLALDLPQATLAEHVDYGRDPTTVFVELPVVLRGLRLGPEVGFGRGSSAAELQWVSAGDGGGIVAAPGDAVEEQRLVVGLSAGPSFRLADEMRAWAGGRAALAVRHSDFSGAEPDRVGVDVSLGTVAGGETFLLDRFSLGGEARLSFTSMDGAVIDPAGAARRGWSFGFDVLAAARLYFD